MSLQEFPASTYPKSIFEPRKPDETQSLGGDPTFNVLLKGYKTRSVIYERMLPDNVSTALKIQGPRGSNSTAIFDHKGQIKFITGPRNPDIPNSGIFGISSQGQQQLHAGRSNIQYNVGGSADEGQALNVLAYGDIVEQAIGGSRYIKATKIFITATDEFIISGQNVKIQAQGELQLAGSSIVQAMTNKKEIVTGQSMELGVSEKSTIQFDPRGQVNIITPGSVNHKILQDYKLKALGCLSLFAVGGPGALVKNRGVGMSLSTKTVFQAGGTAGTDIVSTGFTTVKGVGGVEVSTPAMLDMAGTTDVLLSSEGMMDLTALDLTVDGENTTVTGVNTTVEGTAQAELKGALTKVTGSTKVEISGAEIYLN
tara:strand:+ start:2177 stop:3283 length:1107 start_codon:yes stop_codon:yes gene_type:complete